MSLDSFAADTFTAALAQEAPIFTHASLVQGYCSVKPFSELQSARALGKLVVVLHKGLLNEVPSFVFAFLTGRSTIEFANEVYVVFSCSDISSRDDHVKSYFLSALDAGESQQMAAASDNATTSSKAAVQGRAGRFCAYVGNRTLLTETFFGRKIYLDSEDVSLTPHIAYEGRWEPWVTTFIQDRLRPGAVFFDIGANCGFYSLLAAHHVGETGFVLSVEPQQDLASRVRNSAAVNGFSRFLHVEQCAIGEVNGTGTLNVDRNLKGSSSLLELHGSTAATQVQVRSLPDVVHDVSNGPAAAFCKHRSLHPSLMKIDVEGYEYFVWRGMKDFMRGWGPHTIVLEFSPQRYMALGQDPEQFLSEMLSEGYRVRELRSDGTLLEFDPMQISRVVDEGRYADLVLMKP